MPIATRHLVQFIGIFSIHCQLFALDITPAMSDAIFQRTSPVSFSGTWIALQRIPPDPEAMRSIVEQCDKALREGKLTPEEYGQQVSANREITTKERLTKITVKASVASQSQFVIEQSFEPLQNNGNVIRKFVYHAQADGLVFKTNETLRRIIMSVDSEDTLNTVLPVFLSRLIKYKYGQEWLAASISRRRSEGHAVIFGNPGEQQLRISAVSKNGSGTRVQILNGETIQIELDIKEIVPGLDVLKAFEIRYFSSDGKRIVRDEKWELVSGSENSDLTRSIGKFTLPSNYILFDRVNKIELMTNDLLQSGKASQKKK